MALSPQQVLDARPGYLAKQAEGLMGSIDVTLLERFDGGAVRLGIKPSGPNADELRSRVFAAYEGRGWACRDEPSGWVFEPAPPSKAQQVAHKLYEQFAARGQIGRAIP
jgi:hypothetical protein